MSGEWLRADMNPDDPGSQGYRPREFRDQAREVLLSRGLHPDGVEADLDELEACIPPSRTATEHVIDMYRAGEEYAKTYAEARRAEAKLARIEALCDARERRAGSFGYVLTGGLSGQLRAILEDRS